MVPDTISAPIFERVDDVLAVPWGFRLFIRNVGPDLLARDEVIQDIVKAHDLSTELGYPPFAEITWRDGGMLALTIHAENGMWVWRFVDYDPQRALHYLRWPD